VNLPANILLDDVEVQAWPNRRGPPKGTPKPPGSGRKPGTPNRVTRDLRAAAAKHTKKAVNTLVKLLRDEDPRVQFVAARELLDRGHGKPHQMIVSESSVRALDDTPPSEIARRVMGFFNEARERRDASEAALSLPSPRSVGTPP
jgi:hypothetical protein